MTLLENLTPTNPAAALRRHLTALRALLLLTLVVGLAYPLAVTGISQALFPHQANGSTVTVGGRAVGSSLVGQSFTDAHGNALPQWFQSRPSAAGDGYDATASGASDLGPNSPELLAAVRARRGAAAGLDGVAPGAMPPDALTASGSGLDPHISPAYAEEQVARVAAARHLDPGAVRALVRAHTRGRTLGVLGEPRVDVLELNLALARLR